MPVTRPGSLSQATAMAVNRTQGVKIPGLFLSIYSVRLVEILKYKTQ